MDPRISFRNMGAMRSRPRPHFHRDVSRADLQLSTVVAACRVVPERDHIRLRIASNRRMVVRDIII